MTVIKTMENITFLLPRDAMGYNAVLAVEQCPSVCPSHSCIGLFRPKAKAIIDLFFSAR